MGATRIILSSDSASDDSLVQLPAAEQAELQALHQLADDALRAVAAEQMATSTKERMAQLMEKNSLGKLSLAEHHELTMLVERGDQLMLRKVEALYLLHQRGINSTPLYHNFSGSLGCVG